MANLLRGRIFDQSTVILTSATLTVGGTFDAMARSWGLTGDDEKRRAGSQHRGRDHGKGRERRCTGQREACQRARDRQQAEAKQRRDALLDLIERGAPDGLPQIGPACSVC